MLRSLDEITGYGIEARDGELGKVKDFYFDDIRWRIRYVLVDTGDWLPGRRVLIAPASVGEPDWERAVLPVALTREQVETSPGVDVDRPVSRQKEEELMSYYGWEPYWEPVGVLAAPPPVPYTPPGGHKVKGDPNLRSADEVAGYHIDASDGEMGKVADFIADTDSWAIRYLVVDTRAWLPGRQVLVAPAWIDEIDWEGRLLRVELTREQIEDSPEYDPEAPVNREYETRLYDYYGRPTYWT